MNLRVLHIRKEYIVNDRDTDFTIAVQVTSPEAIKVTPTPATVDFRTFKEITKWISVIVMMCCLDGTTTGATPQTGAQQFTRPIITTETVAYAVKRMEEEESLGQQDLK